MPPHKSRATEVTFAAARPPPPFYTTATPDEISEALEIGASLYGTLKSMRAETTAEELRALEERKQAEIAKVRAAADERMQELSAELASTATAAQAAQRELKQRLQTIEDTTRQEEREQQQRAATAKVAVLEQRYEALQERKTALEACRDQDIRIAEERTRLLLQHAMDEKERAIQRSERMLEQLQDAYTRQTDELRTLGDLIRRKPSANVKVKGSEYEAIFREKLLAAYGLGDGFSLVDTAHQGVGHAGDYLMTWGGHTILWEVKNYDKPVPTAEVDKFRRDMKENQHVRIGVMVSRYTPITGKTAKGDRDIEFIEGKMLLYLSNFEQLGDEILPSLMLLFRLWWESEKNTEEAESKEAMFRSIERLHANAVKSKTEWRLHKTRMEEALRWMAEVVEEHEHKLQHAIHILRGATILQVPEGIFRACDGDERSQQLIQLVLEHVEPSATDSVVLNELADKIGKVKGLSRDTAKTHIRSVLLDTAIEPPKGKQPARVMGVQWKSSGAALSVSALA
jgi:hypothetical protein